MSWPSIKDTVMSVPGARAALCEHWDSFFKQKKLFLTLGYASWRCLCCGEARTALWDSPAADAHRETLSLLCSAPNTKPLVFVGCAGANPVFLSLVGSSSALHRLLRITKAGEEGVSCTECLVLVVWSRGCVCCWSQSSLYPWACAVVLSSNGENLFFWKPKCVTFSMNSDA